MRNGFFDRRSTGIYCVPKSNCRRSTTPVSVGNYSKKCLLSLLKFRRTLAPSGDRKAQNSELKLATSRDNSDFPLSHDFNSLYSVGLCFFNAYRKIRGAMKREIFLYGHFGYCFSLGRNVCSDDLVKKMQSKKQAPLAPVFFGVRYDSGCSATLFAASRPSARNMLLMPRTA